MAAEDIGLADPEALKLAVAARDAYHMLGPPEGYLPLAQMVVYLATAPKSNSSKAALRRGAGGGARASRGRGAAAHPERAHRADEGTGVWSGVSVRARRRRRHTSRRSICRSASAARASTSPGRSASRRRSRSGWHGGRSFAGRRAKTRSDSAMALYREEMNEETRTAGGAALRRLPADVRALGKRGVQAAVVNLRTFACAASD